MLVPFFVLWAYSIPYSAACAVECRYKKMFFTRWDANVEDAVLGFVQTESDPEERFRAIMADFRRLAMAAP